jgi:hypothetical protein
MVVTGWHLATVAVAGNSARERPRPRCRRGTPGNQGCPASTGCGLEERGHSISAMKARHALAGTLKMPLSRFLVSRTMTASAALATSTHSPPFAPE